MTAPKPFVRHDRDYLNKPLEKRGFRLRARVTLANGLPAYSRERPNHDR